MGLGYWLKALFALALAVAGAGAARAEERIAVCIARGEGAPAAVLAHPERFDCKKAQNAWGPGDYWALSRPLPTGAGVQPSLVRIYSLWQDNVSLWALYADGRVVPVTRVIGSSSASSSLEYVLPARGVAINRLLWRVQGAANTRGILVGVRLVTVAEHARNNADSAMILGWFAGACAAFLFINLALWAALRRPFQLAYCTMATGLLLHATAGSGLFRRLSPAIDPLMELRISNFTFSLCIVGGLWFSRSFLEPQVVGRRVERIAGLAGYAMLGTAAVRVLAPRWHTLAVDRLQASTFLLAIGVMGLLGWCAWTRRSQFRGIWTIIVIVPALLAGFRAANGLQLFGKVFPMQEWMLAMMAAGMFASSLAIAYRIHLLDRERAEARAQEVAARLLADTDPLTGLLNRRSFLAEAIGRPGQQTLLIADLDHFKDVNETIGHDGGDDVLRSFARALRGAVPAGALVARIGGEEFAVIVDQTAGMVPNRVLDQLRSAPMPYDMTITTSVGTCTGPLLRETDWKHLYRQADRALYAAKTAGRDRARDAGSLPLAA